MAKIKLAALDVDGTLIRSDLTLSPAVMRALESLRDAGVTVSVVTGRTMGELIEFRQLLPWIRYYVVSNGTTALDTERNTIFYRRYLPLETARAIEYEARRYSTLTEVYADGVSYVNFEPWAHFERYTTEDLHHPSLAAGRVPLESVGDLLAARENDIEKFHILFERKEDIPKLIEFCSKFDVETVLSIHDGLEITRKGVEKGSGLAALCDYLQISLDETAAVGDGLPDIAMFRRTGLSIVMENAQEQVRLSATLVAPGNNADGAVWAIEQILRAR